MTALPAPGSMAAYSALDKAMDAYTLRPSELHRALLYRHALNCGMPVTEPSLTTWVNERMLTLWTLHARQVCPPAPRQLQMAGGL